MLQVTTQQDGKTWRATLITWLPVGIGLSLLYLPTFYDLATGIWSTESYAHGPIILSISIWMLIRQWPDMLSVMQFNSGSSAGWFIITSALFMYAVGRSQAMIVAELGSFIGLISGILIVVHGGSAFKLRWFPFIFMLFMLPLPSDIVAVLTLPMKTAVSYATDELLFGAGYPIARNGVTLQIGQYQLLVADACAGLQTLLTLEALGLVYLNLVRHPSLLRNVTLALFIFPISFSANVIRVVALTLITFYYGNEVGQGFLHGFAGIVLFITALILIVIIDSFLQFAIERFYTFKTVRQKAEFSSDNCL